MSKEKKELSFSLTLKTLPVKLDGEKYTLKELTGDARDNNMDATRERMNFSEDGKPAGFKSFKGLQADLLALSLYDKHDKLVSKEVILAFPASVQNELFKAAQELSALEDEKENDESAKND